MLKRNIIKYLCFALMLGAVSCTEPLAEPTADDSVLRVETKLIPAGYEGGDFDIHYNVEGPQVEVEASCSARWVKVKEYAENCVKIHLSENASGEDRFAELYSHQRRATASRYTWHSRKRMKVRWCTTTSASRWKM